MQLHLTVLWEGMNGEMNWIKLDETMFDFVATNDWMNLRLHSMGEAMK